MKDVELYVGIAAGILTAISLLPQLIKIIRTKKADDVSWGMLIVLFLGVGLWIWYGVLKEDYPIMITNSFSALINMLVMFFSFRFKRNTSA